MLRFSAAMLAILSALVLAATAAAAPKAQNTALERLDVYTGEVSGDQLQRIVDLGVDRRELDVTRAAGRGGAKAGLRVEAILSGRQVQALRRDGLELQTKRVDGQSAAAARDRAGGRRLRGLQALRRRRRTQGGVRAGGGRQPAHRQARDLRPHGQRPGHRGPQGVRERPHATRRRQARRALPRRPARPRVDHAGDDPAAHALHPRRLRGQPRDPAAGGRERAVVRPRRQPRRLRLQLPGRPAAVAQEPARQQRRRHDRRRRRRRPQSQLPDQVGLRQRGLLPQSRERDLPRSRPGL